MSAWLGRRLHRDLLRASPRDRTQGPATPTPLVLALTQITSGGRSPRPSSRACHEPVSPSLFPCDLPARPHLVSNSSSLGSFGRYEIYSHSYLGLGQKEASKNLQDKCTGTTRNAPQVAAPCYLSGFQTPAPTSCGDQNITGTGSYQGGVLHIAFPLLCVEVEPAAPLLRLC